MIEALRRERDEERHAHAETRRIADEKVLELEAMISRHEAELESCVSKADHSPFPEKFLRRPRSQPLSLAPALDDEILSALDITTARNKLLEAEIKVLSARVCMPYAAIAIRL